MSEHLVRVGDTAFNLLDARLEEAELGDWFTTILRAFVEDTYETCAFYSTRWDRTGVKPHEIASYEAWKRIPLLVMEDVQAASEFDLLPDRYRAAASRAGLAAEFAQEDHFAKRFQTSSTTGNPKVSYYTIGDWNANCALVHRQHSHLPQATMARILNCFHAGHFGGNNIYDSFSRVGSIVANRHFTYNAAEQVLSQLKAGLRSVGAFTMMCAPPWTPGNGGPTKGISVDDLLDADIDNHIGENIRVILMAGAPADEPEYRIQERVWEANEIAGAPRTHLLVKYGSSEVGLVASGCDAHLGEPHICQGLIYTEVIDPNTGEHVKSGERGLVVCTALRRGSRYVRYVIGDEATYIAERCECGRKTPRLGEIRRVLDRQRLARGGCAAGGF